MAVSSERMDELYALWDKENHLPAARQDKTSFREQRKWRNDLSEEEKEVLSFWDSCWLLES